MFLENSTYYSLKECSKLKNRCLGLWDYWKEEKKIGKLIEAGYIEQPGNSVEAALWKKTAGVQQINKSAGELPATVKSTAAVKQIYTVSICLNVNVLNMPRTDRQLCRTVTSAVFAGDNCSWEFQHAVNVLF